jgi:hypothetical protein
MRFAADYSETLEVFFCDADRWNKRPSLRSSVTAIFTFLSQLFVKWRLCRNTCFVWDGFLRRNQSARLNEMTAHSSITNL